MCSRHEQYYWLGYWVILGCYWKLVLVLGIVKAFSKNWYWYWVLLSPLWKYWVLVLGQKSGIAHVWCVWNQGWIEVLNTAQFAEVYFIIQNLKNLVTLAFCTLFAILEKRILSALPKTWYYWPSVKLVQSFVKITQINIISM